MAVRPVRAACPNGPAAHLRLSRLATLATLATAAVLASLPVASSAQAGRPQSTGVYADSGGKTHPWSVTGTNTLIWENTAYVPIGGTFAPRYLAGGASSATEENWAKDVAALEVLKGKGVLDIIIQPVASAVDVPAASWQKVIDYLEAQGFHYGICFGAGITSPLTGVVVKPTNYRMEDVRENMDLTWNVTDSDSAIFVVVDGTDATQVQREGRIRVRDGSATVPSEGRVAAGSVAILYPHKTLPARREGSLPDVWGSFDRYRDRVLGLFKKVKLGPGLRFFLDPLAHPLSLQGETDFLVPDSPGFRLEWEGYLTLHYPSIDDLMNAWNIQERSIKDFKQAAVMMPLSVNGRGVPYMIDLNTGKRLETRGSGDRFWSDLRGFRNESLSYYMNATADLLKREIANVPVVYTRTHQHAIFAHEPRPGGFDGLGMAAYGRGSAIVTSGADSVYSQANESLKPIWCLVTETQDTVSPTKAQLGYASKEALFYDLDWLRGIGAKGFFVNGFQVMPEEPYKNFQMVRAPEQIAWLKEYSDKLNRGISIGAGKPNTLPYPTDAAGIVHAGPIGNGGNWWVPSTAPGKMLHFGSSYAGYTIRQTGGEMTVMWSLRGPRQTRLVVADPRTVTITTADGLPVAVKTDLKKKTVLVTMDENPLIIKGNDPEIFPIEAVEDVLVQLKSLVDQAEEAKLSIADYKYKMDRAVSNYKHNEPRMAFIMAADALNGIVNVIQPYTWLEAERAESHTFSEIAQNDAASNAGFLTLNTEARPGASGYGAVYRFSVPTDDSYSLWIAGTPPGPQASPFVWIVDAEQPRSSADASVVGSPYLSNQFAWMNLGRVPLTKGMHTLTLRVTDTASGLGRYVFATDALLLTRGAFSPNGITKPAIGSLADNHILTDKPKKAGDKGKDAKRAGPL